MARSDYRFVWNARARYAEVDAQAVVFNSRYLEYFDIGLVEYWRAAGIYSGDGLAGGPEAHVAKAVEHNQVWLARVSEALSALGLEVTPSVTNFILIHFPDRDEKRAEDADRFLTERGFVLRAVSSYGFPNALRMTIGSEEANTGVIAALTEFMERT